MFSSLREWFSRYRALSLSAGVGAGVALWLTLRPTPEKQLVREATDLVESVVKYRSDRVGLGQHVLPKIDPQVSLQIVELPDVTSSRDGLLPLLRLLEGDAVALELAFPNVYLPEPNAPGRVSGELKWSVARSGEVLTGQRRVELGFEKKTGEYRLTRVFVAGPPNDKPEARP